MQKRQGEHSRNKKDWDLVKKQKRGQCGWNPMEREAKMRLER